MAKKARVEWFGDGILGKARQAAFRGVVRGTESVAETAIRKMQSGTKSGRTYRRRGKTHIASAPGEAPAVDSGRLVQSTTTKYNPTELYGTVNWATEYAAALEYGTQKMGARPYARVSLAERRDEIKADIQREIKEALS